MSISYTPENKPYKKLTPFKRYVLQNFPWINEDFDALTNYELMGKIIEYLNNVIDSQNELNNKFEEIYNYFENLDVQEEINAKLDEMAEGGQLAEIINQEIFDDLNEEIQQNKTDIETINKKIFGNVPKVHYIYRNGQYGDAIAIEIENNNILIDLGIADGLDNLIAYLITNNITKFKYMMISHWDIDHSSTTDGFKRVIENAGLDFSECTFILPPQCDWSRMTGVDGQQIRCEEITNYLIANNYTIKYPTEQEIITLDENNFMRFYNYNPAFITQYETIMLDDANMPIDRTQINNISGVMELNSFGKTFLFTGDIYPQAEENIADEIPKINVLKVSHHGINRYNSPSFMKKINPEIRYYNE